MRINDFFDLFTDGIKYFDKSIEDNEKHSHRLCLSTRFIDHSFIHVV